MLRYLCTYEAWMFGVRNSPSMLPSITMTTTTTTTTKQQNDDGHM